MFTYAYGFPRLGLNKEFKTSIENFWKGEIEEAELISSLDNVEKERKSFYKQYIDEFPMGEFTYYDHFLDTALMLGIYKFRNLNEYFKYGRGENALPLKKYFNTNYHYLVPKISKNVKFKIKMNNLPFDPSSSFSNPRFLIGPYTFLKLSMVEGEFKKVFIELGEVYKGVIDKLREEKVSCLHIEEPAFVLDVPYKEVRLIKSVYKNILRTNIKVNLITYYEKVDFLKELYELPFYSFALDFIAGRDNLTTIKREGFPKEKRLICGVVNGRNPLRTDIFSVVKFVERIKKLSKLDKENLLVSNSCPLFHLPLTIEKEKFLASSIKEKMSFAKERLYELHLIKSVFLGNDKEAEQWNKFPLPSLFNLRMSNKLYDTLSERETTFLKRREVQKMKLNLPPLPTTTIGSFPQDKELRRIRARYRKNLVSPQEYEKFIKEKIGEVIKLQEEIGLDVLTHGEFERSDMVEFFAQKLEGFATTTNGFIISYGTRVYRPPIIYSRIKRKEPITLEEIKFAQSITTKPVKGILTGPVTILSWSYNLRKDALPRIAFEIANVLNEEAKDLVRNNIKIIQIDEPAIKEFAPLKKNDQNYYFSWAIRSFNLTARLPQEVQVHTHMCYSQFERIIKWILKMNFDVITVEAARDRAEVINAFRKARFLRQIGPGVWDIHSCYPANKKVIEEIVKKAVATFGKENIWLNPDCGLKTRDWEEVETSLRMMVKIARKYRKELWK
ncbi:MAG: 5-methyltetrahydropteroyltriglutamate--homocysteine S-methyltransferase [Candidatus Omnitrophica bacterium 4484_70.1]|nr:MAG: 5-methyltetrahydropteroyltriglutamate--homocysteine S-methyltransferase [Candidatus Omnitrophica bacterium 4484_70.1]